MECLTHSPAFKSRKMAWVAGLGFTVSTLLPPARAEKRCPWNTPIGSRWSPSTGVTFNQRKLGKPYFMCFRALLYAVFHSIRIGFEGSKLKIVDQHASDGRVSHFGFPFLRWLQVYMAAGRAEHAQLHEQQSPGSRVLK